MPFQSAVVESPLFVHAHFLEVDVGLSVQAIKNALAPRYD